MVPKLDEITKIRNFKRARAVCTCVPSSIEIQSEIRTCIKYLIGLALVVKTCVSVHRPATVAGGTMGRVWPSQVHGAISWVLRDRSSRTHWYRLPHRPCQLDSLLLHHQGPACAAIHIRWIPGLYLHDGRGSRGGSSMLPGYLRQKSTWWSHPDYHQ